MMKSLLTFLLGLRYSRKEGATPGSSLTQTLIMIGIALVFFYFILWRPEQKRRKASEQMRASLKKGDRVTAMGILGRVENIKEHTVILKMVDGTKIEFLKGAISDVQLPRKRRPKPLPNHRFVGIWAFGSSSLTWLEEPRPEWRGARRDCVFILLRDSEAASWRRVATRPVVRHPTGCTS